MKIKDKFKSLKLNWKFTIVIIIAIIIPIAVFAGVLFYNLEQNVIDTNLVNLEYSCQQSISNVNNCVDSINMATQFFLSDTEMKDALMKAAAGEQMTTEELVKFQDTDIKNLERLVSTNPLLYSVRIFAANDNVQEMMQILYKNKRAQSLEWMTEPERNGWHFGIRDTAFSALLTNQKDRLVCLVSPINDTRVGELGIVEASMKMSIMFPSLYEEHENSWCVYIVDDEDKYSRDGISDTDMELVNKAWSFQENNGESASYTKIDGRKIVVTSLYVKELGGTLLFVRDISDEVKHIYHIRNMFIIMMVILLIALSFLINGIVNRMLQQFYSILKSIRQVQHGNLDVRIEHCDDDEMGELGSQLNTMLDRVQKLMAENIDREVMIKDSEVRALQNQINAHFIYNVLESIKMMAEIDEEYEISDSITSLGKLLRYSMRWVSGNVTVAEELDYIKNYMALINLRYDFVVNLSVNIPENLLQQQIPKMSLQPVVENAILHGIEPLGVDSTIYIKGTTDGKDTMIEITDTGRGMTVEELEALKKGIRGEATGTKEKGNGIGLHNVENRIKMTFGEEYGMTILTEKDCYTKISIRLPYKRSEG